MEFSCNVALKRTTFTILLRFKFIESGLCNVATLYREKKVGDFVIEKKFSEF